MCDQDLALVYLIFCGEMDDFQSQTMPQLLQFLKICGFIINGVRKPTLVSLCQAAVSTGTDVDPDGLLENVAEVEAAKLGTGHFAVSRGLAGRGSGFALVGPFPSSQCY